jgi:hypothetical protein
MGTEVIALREVCVVGRLIMMDRKTMGMGMDGAFCDRRMSRLTRFCFLLSIFVVYFDDN